MARMYFYRSAMLRQHSIQDDNVSWFYKWQHKSGGKRQKNYKERERKTRKKNPNFDDLKKREGGGGHTYWKVKKSALNG